VIDNTLGPLCWAEDLDVSPHEPDGMRFRNSILQVPTVLRLLRERDEFLSSVRGEDAMVFVLATILELDWTFPC
jgi:hypothetical protein